MSAKNVQAIQMLRGVAATAVVCHHLADTVREHSTTGLSWARWFNTDVGSIGVDLFFIISGFIMAYTTDDGRSTRGAFLSRRMVRIYPLYWFYSCLVLLLFLALPWSGRIDASWEDVVKSFLLYPTLNTVGLVRPAILPQGWTLSFEMFFYLAFAAFLPLTLGRRVIAVSAILLLAQVGSKLLPGTSAELNFLREDTLMEFSLGLGLAYLVLKTKFRLNKNSFVLVLCLGALALAPEIFWMRTGDHSYRLLTLAVPATLVVGALVLYPGVATFQFPRWTILLGDASYTIYLVHVMILGTGAASRTFARFIDHSPNLAYATLFIAIMGAGVAGYFLIERPLLRLSRSHKLAAAKMPPAAQPTLRAMSPTTN